MVVRSVANVYTSLAKGLAPEPIEFGSLHQLIQSDLAYRSSAQYAEYRENWLKCRADLLEQHDWYAE